jgi:2-C-methyl-D-erythritol 4-phosphate cytidylyltransferase
MRAGFGAVIAAAGSGVRFGAKKQFIELAGRPLLHYSLDAFAALEESLEIIVVAAAEDVERAGALLAAWEGPRGGRLRPRAIEGGARRQDSVRRGIEALAGSVEWALVHDAARPLVRPEDVRRVMEAVREHGAAAIGYQASDSLKEERGGKAVRGLDRGRIWQVQTPQGARLDLLLAAYAALAPGDVRTDEAAVLEAIGVEARLVSGSRENIKVTEPGDEALAEFWLRRR